ncbi:MAG: helix-turn-helix transcriptional regulator [Oscillospiraceae bacterium]|nr:helix-turn-helix transcriptional regulator [Oscillospiraceae bacterium]
MNRIKEIREKTGIQQKELAERAGISRAYLCDLEKNRRGARPETFEKIADALNVPVDDLVQKVG